MVTTPPESGKQAQSQPESLGDALEVLARRLEEADLFFGHGTDNAWDEAVQLVLHVMNLGPDSDRSVAGAPVSMQQWGAMTLLTDRRIAERLPLPYLLGKACFAGLEFRCDARALVPRSPIAELIVNDYAPWWQGGDMRRILDLCCGGGSIGIAAAQYAPAARVTLADIDAAALSLARENVELHGLSERVELRESDLFARVPPEPYDLILCNPPYVDADDLAAMPAEYHAEPPRGLGAGDEGLDLAIRILLDAERFLAPTGCLFLELGNSWLALDALLASQPLTWVEFEHGGHGVLALPAAELPALQVALARAAREGGVRV